MGWRSWAGSRGAWYNFIHTQLTLILGWIIKFIIPLIIGYVAICLYFHFYIRLAMSIFFTGLFLVTKIPAVRKWLVVHADNCAVADAHWKNDIDLVWLWRFIKCIYALGFVLLVTVPLHFD